MSYSSRSEKLGGRMPSDTERQSASQLHRILASKSQEDGRVSIGLINQAGRTDNVVLTPGLSALLMELLGHIGAGSAVTLVPVHQMLTTQRAADILNVSRPYFISLLDSGVIPFTLVGRHRRIKADDLFAYQDRRDTERAEALAALIAEDADLI